jgi:hypothetical protein
MARDLLCCVRHYTGPQVADIHEAAERLPGYRLRPALGFLPSDGTHSGCVVWSESAFGSREIREIHTAAHVIPGSLV